MGLITDTIRLHQLRGRRIFLQYNIQQLAITKSSLTHACDDLMKTGTDYDPESPVMKTLQQRQARLKVVEEQLAHQTEQYQLELEMVEAEYNSCKARIKQDIQQAFSYSFG